MIRSLSCCLLVVVVVTMASCGGPPPVQTGPVPPGPAPDMHEVEHPVRAGETLASIADLYYDDPTRAEAIAAFNGVDVNARLAAGSVLRLRFAPAELASARLRQAAMGPFNRGVTAMEQGDLEEAERQFRLARRTAPDLQMADYNLALVLGKRGRHEQAADLLAPLVAARPTDADYGFALGNALFYQTRYQDASRIFTEVLAHHPDHRRACFGRARALHEAGDREAALAAWTRYLELDDTSPWADEARRLRRSLRGH